mmetsp:Transcript_82465/g.163696  ORF Transcript_82465/g.163696 Transcript_82465/m.163696 type:complete len:245 (+) Transcript_82465:486-1220(+)
MRMAVSLTFLRTFNSPSGQRWQCAHASPLRHPFAFHIHAQGLHLPKSCSAEPVDGSATSTGAVSGKVIGAGIVGNANGESMPTSAKSGVSSPFNSGARVSCSLAWISTFTCFVLSGCSISCSPDFPSAVFSSFSLSSPSSLLFSTASVLSFSSFCFFSFSCSSSFSSPSSSSSFSDCSSSSSSCSSMKKLSPWTGVCHFGSQNIPKGLIALIGVIIGDWSLGPWWRITATFIFLRALISPSGHR